MIPRLSPIFIILLSVISAFRLKAEEPLTLMQANSLPSLYNPARCGDSEWLRLGAAGIFTAKGNPKAPYGFAGAADCPVSVKGMKLGGGIAFEKRSVGMTKSSSALLQASCRIPLANGELSLGINAGLTSISIKSSAPAPPVTQTTRGGEPSALAGNKLKPSKKTDFGFGASWKCESFRTGLSLLHSTSPTVRVILPPSNSSSDSTMVCGKIRAALYFDASSNIATGNPLILLQTSLLAALSPTNSSVDIQFGPRWFDKIYTGIGYRWGRAVFFRAEVDLKNVFFGYSFGLPTTAAARQLSFRHEIAAGYRMKVDFSGTKRYKQRSIRIM